MVCFTIRCLDVDFFLLIRPAICWTSWICGLASFRVSGKFSAIIFSNTAFAPCLPFSESNYKHTRFHQFLCTSGPSLGVFCISISVLHSRFSSFALLLLGVILIDVPVLKQSFIPEITSLDHYITSFYTLLYGFYSLTFMEDFCVHAKHCLVVFPHCVSSSAFRVVLASQNETASVPSSLISWKSFLLNQYSFFLKCSIQFTSEAIWAYSFFEVRILTTNSVSLINKYRVMEVIYFFLCQLQWFVIFKEFVPFICQIYWCKIIHNIPYYPFSVCWICSDIVPEIGNEYFFFFPLIRDYSGYNIHL